LQLVADVAVVERGQLEVHPEPVVDLHRHDVLEGDVGQLVGPADGVKKPERRLVAHVFEDPAVKLGHRGQARLDARRAAGIQPVDGAQALDGDDRLLRSQTDALGEPRTRVVGQPEGLLEDAGIHEVRHLDRQIRRGGPVRREFGRRLIVVEAGGELRARRGRDGGVEQTEETLALVLQGRPELDEVVGFAQRAVALLEDSEGEAQVVGLLEVARNAVGLAADPGSQRQRADAALRPVGVGRLRPAEFRGERDVPHAQRVGVGRGGRSRFLRPAGSGSAQQQRGQQRGAGEETNRSRNGRARCGGGTPHSKGAFARKRPCPEAQPLSRTSGRGLANHRPTSRCF